MDAIDPHRASRQLLHIDRLLGLEAVPFELIEAPVSVAPESRQPAALPHSGQTAPAMASIPRSVLRSIPANAPLTDDGATRPLPPNAMSKKKKIAALAELEQEVAAFLKAKWPKDGWQNVVFGEGDPDADLMFIGEGPGADEDRLGRPFVGRAGQLLDKQIGAMGLQREQVYIANIAKCRPPGNRVPTPEEAEKTMPFLERQIEIIAPKVIVTLGATSAKYLLRNPKLAITKERGQWTIYRGVDLMPTFHPAYLLRQYTAENRRRVWEDLKAVLIKLGLPVPNRNANA